MIVPMSLDAVTQARYRIVQIIGRGGMGEVCLADDLMLHRQVALKFLSSTKSNALDQILREARSAAALSHPFICSIYEVTTLNDRPCIAMEYVRGETLERRLRRGPLALNEGLRLAEEIAEALEAAHKRRVIHRDLKPANVMLTEDQHIKVMDFGLATRLATLEGLGDEMVTLAPADTATVGGTPAYMAPEQIRGSAPDHRSDIFSFGVLLHELLSGTNPFRRMGIDATLAAILETPVPNLHDVLQAIPTSVDAVIGRMLAKDPAARYQSFAALRMDLRGLAVNLSASTPHSVVVDGPTSGGSAALLGRSVERAHLREAIRESVSGRGSLILLSGEAGIGKTRLADDALKAARGLGCQTLVGRCHEHDGTPPLIAYIEVLEEASRLLPAPAFRQALGTSAPELAKLLPELQRLFPDMAAPLELPPNLRQRFLFTNVREFLSRCSRLSPLVVFIDDFQWADESALQLTLHLAQHVATLPMTMIVAYREAEVATTGNKSRFQNLFDRVRGQTREAFTARSIKTALDTLVRQRQARAISLRAFTEIDVRAMLATLGRDDPPPRLVKKFLEQTGGNPFFVEELFRYLNDEGRLFDARNAWRRDVDLDQVDVPESVRTVLDRRLEHVSSDAQKVLRIAAVIGRSFELDLLEAVAEIDADTLLSALEEAEQARLVKGPSGRQETSWRFAHPLICQTLTAAVPQLRRQRLHLRVADGIARLDLSSRVHASDLAHHLYRAGPAAAAAQTARALRTAGDAAYAVYATEEAVQHYRRALEVLASSGPPTGDSARKVAGDSGTRLDIEERLADVLALIGDRAPAMEHYRTLSALYDSGRAPVDRARIARKMGTLQWQSGDRRQAMESYQRALEAVDGSPAHIESAHLFQELGLAAFRSGDNEQAIEWAERALRSAEGAVLDGASAPADLRRAATVAIAHATNTIGVAMARAGQLDAARERIERSVTIAREQGLLDVACRGYANLGVLYSTVEPKRAIEVSLTGLELASEIGAVSLQSYMYANLAAAYCALTDRCETEGLQAAHASVDLDRELGQLDHLAVPLIVMGQIHQCQGELQEAEKAYREALALAERIQEPQLILPCYDGLATICLDRGDRDGAERYMESARELCQRTGLDPDTVLLLPFLC